MLCSVGRENTPLGVSFNGPALQRCRVIFANVVSCCDRLTTLLYQAVMARLSRVAHP